MTINEARTVLGRDPLTDAAANRPMVLTASGYVPLGQEAPVKKRPGYVTRFDPYHDERGRFTTADGVGTGADQPAQGRVQVASNDPHMPVRVAGAEPPPEVPEEENRSGEDENRGRSESVDPFVRQQFDRWNAATETLQALDPQNPRTYLTSPDWVPTDQNIADINAEIAKVAVQRATDFWMPGGALIGTPGNGPDVREVPGGAKAAQDAFDYLSVGSTPYTGTYPGTMVVLPGNVGWVGLRNNSDGIPTVDVRVPGVIRSTRFHYK